MRKDVTACNARRDRLISLIFVAVIMCVVAVGFDYYYDLNDDVLMKDILSGIYTGVPETHNIQMLWPVSALFAFLYKVCPVVPWMGVVLCLIQYVCLYLIEYRTLTFFSSTIPKIVMVAVSAAIVFSFLLEHIVFIQYTITAAMMAATAAYLFYTVREGLNEKQFIKAQILPVVLVAGAFLIRSELMMMLMPLMGVTVLIRWNREKQPLSKTSIKRYLILIVSVFALLGISYGADKAAYSSKDWNTFETMFDNRTQLYDYQSIPGYYGNSEFYSSIGLSKSEQKLLENYNYGIDEKIDGSILGKTAKYADSIRTENTKQRLVRAFAEYKYRNFHKSADFPWNLTMIVLYVAVLVAILMRNEGTWKGNFLKAVCRLGFLFAVRSALWMYILYVGRYPARITHSLYFMEMCILMAMLLVEFRCKVRDQNFMMMLNGVIAAVALCILTPYNINDVRIAQNQREYVNKNESAIRTYCAEHADSFYFEDVYSTVDFSQKVFDNTATSAGMNRRIAANTDIDRGVPNTDINSSPAGTSDDTESSVNSGDSGTYNGASNIDILGGWACGSPLWYKKHAEAGIESVSDSLISDKNVYLISEKNADMSWITDYYTGIGKTVKVKKTDDISGAYGVYKILESK